VRKSKIADRAIARVGLCEVLAVGDHLAPQLLGAQTRGVQDQDEREHGQLPVLGRGSVWPITLCRRVGAVKDLPEPVNGEACLPNALADPGGLVGIGRAVADRPRLDPRRPLKTRNPAVVGRSDEAL
jgi:hypothetical protein